ncbi:helix-turn-helix domain-containing protein [Acetobacter indonesiensis]
MPLLRKDDLWCPEKHNVPSRKIDDVKRKFIIYREEKDGEQAQPQKTLYQDFLHWIIRNKASVERKQNSKDVDNNWSPSLILGKKIARVRKEHGMTQEDLARILDVSRSAIALMETGRSCRARTSISKIVDLFELEPEFFLSDTQSKELIEISEDEKTLLKMYRMLNTTDKIDAQQYMERRTKYVC